MSGSLPCFGRSGLPGKKPSAPALIFYGSDPQEQFMAIQESVAHNRKSPGEPGLAKYRRRGTHSMYGRNARESFHILMLFTIIYE